MIGSLIGAGLGIAGSIFGGISASKAMKKRKQQIENEKLENENAYQRAYNEDATQRADAQRLLQKTEESIRNRNKAVAGAAAVMGGTDQSVAAAQEANNQATAEAASQIAASAAARKDQVQERYESRKAELDSKLQDMEQQRAMNTSQAIQGVAGAAGGIAGALDELETKKSDKPKVTDATEGGTL